MPQTPPKLNERVYRTEGIVLSRLDYGEADRIVTIFTPARGKIKVIAKGTRRPLSRLGPQIEYFSRTRFHLTRGRELDIVTGVESIDPHLRLREDLDALSHASHMVEILNRLTEERQENDRAYTLLMKSLRLLCDGVDPFAVTRYYELAMLAALGYRPELYRCVSCNKEIVAEANALSPSMGGLLCPMCRSDDPASYPLSINAQKYLRLLDRSGLADAIGLQLDPRTKGELEGGLGAIFRFLAERELSSLRVWREIRGTAAATPPPPVADS